MFLQILVLLLTHFLWVSMITQLVKESTCNAGDPGLIPGLGRSPGEGKWQLTPVFMPGKSHGLGSLAGYSP